MEDTSFHSFSLPNGIKAGLKRVTHSRVSHIAITFNIGSRDEEEGQHGMAHLWEHMAFKGTNKRSAFRVLNEVESLGGELNGFTTKEKVCLYTTTLSDHARRAINLLTDIAFHSSFPAKEIEKEKSIILEEMAGYEDSPEEKIIDEFEDILFKDHPLGHNILGDKKSIQNYSSEDLKGFISKNIHPENIAITLIGPQTKRQFHQLVKGAGEMAISPNKRPDRNKNVEHSQGKKKSRKIEGLGQTYHVMGGLAPSLNSPERLKMALLVNYLGGPALNSRLNYLLREKNGMVYHVEMNYQPFSDTGYFIIYFQTDSSKKNKVVRLIESEVNTLLNKPLGTRQLEKLKQQFLGQLAISEEQLSNQAFVFGVALLNDIEIESFEELETRVNKISSQELQEFASSFLNPKSFHHLSFAPI